jgi:hypothetical protein
MNCAFRLLSPAAKSTVYALAEAPYTKSTRIGFKKTCLKAHFLPIFHFILRGIMIDYQT